MEGPDATSFALRIAATLFFVAVNGFFVAAEFALVKARVTQLDNLARKGVRRARVAHHIAGNLNYYLSACQLGITLASLILGWLAEPAVAELLLVGATAAGWNSAALAPYSHAVALVLALTIVTVLHMTLGEQAPKIWAIRRATPTALLVAYPLRIFSTLFRPFIVLINGISNGILHALGLRRETASESSHDVDEIKSILATSAQAGHLTARQLNIAKNVLSLAGLEVRHILVPRVDVVILLADDPIEEQLRIIRETGHTRLPLCEKDLDTIIGIVHVKDLVGELLDGGRPDLGALARNAIVVSETQPVSRMIGQMQRERRHCALVVDERGSALGLAFLEDAIEHIVGTIRDEFDEEVPVPTRADDGSVRIPGNLALPEAMNILDLPDLGDPSDTIGGLVIAELGRLPEKGDELQIGQYRVTVLATSRRRIDWLRFKPLGEAAHP